jgi:hypothetical protein
MNYGSSAPGAPAAGSGGNSYCMYIADGETSWTNGYIEPSSDCGLFLHNGGGFFAHNVIVDGISDGGSLVQVQFDAALTQPIPNYIRGDIDASGKWKFSDGTTVTSANFQQGSIGAYLYGATVLGTLHFPDTAAANYLGAGQFSDTANYIYNSGGYFYFCALNGFNFYNPLSILMTSPNFRIKDTNSNMGADISIDSGGNLNLYSENGKAIRVAASPLQLDPLSAAPASPATGMVTLANQTNWDPLSLGSGGAYPTWYNGSAWKAFGNGGPTTSLTPGTTVAITASAGTTYTLTPAQTETITVSGGIEGKDLYLLILTSGTTSYTLTFGTGFHATGTLATGSTTGKYFMLHFKDIGGTFYEVSRTAAM